MTAQTGWLVNPAWAAVVGAALVQFVWEGAAVGLAAMAAQPLLRRARPETRYAFYAAAMLALPFVFAVTVAAQAAGGAATPAWSPAVLAAVEPWLAAAWVVGMGVCACYTAGGWLLTLRLRRSACFAIPALWRERVRELSRCLGLARAPELAESAGVASPCVVGWWRPLILVPLGVLTALPADHMNMLLAHELAHVRRHDWLVNLLQRAIEAMFFFHPAVWWLSRQLAEERELCCDDAAVALGGDRLGYARALVEMAAARGAVSRVRTAMAVAATGGSLRRRVRRLLGVAPAAAGGLGLAAGLLAVAILGALASGRGPLPLPPLASAPVPVAAPMTVIPPAARPAPAALDAGPVRPAPAALPAAPAVLSSAVLSRMAPAPRPTPAPRYEKIILAWAPTGIAACAPQVVFYRHVNPYGLTWFTVGTVTRCTPVMKPVEVVVLTT
ncbi:MAG: M56 family metallopeptidase [Terriglobales bacterium]